MRIRKLATDLGTGDAALLGLLHSLGHGRYTDVEQQVPAAIEAQLRRHLRDLPKLVPPPIRAALPAPRLEEIEPDHALFAQAMAGVRPIGAAPKQGAAPRASAAPRALVSGLASHAADAAARLAPSRHASPLVPTSAPAPLPGPVDIAMRVRMLDAEEQVAELRGRLEQLASNATTAQARATAAEEALAEAQVRLAAIEAAYAEVDQHRRQLQRGANEETTADPATWRAIFERRGLRGEDEIGAALRALLDGHRVGELIRLELSDPASAEEFLWERVMLLSEGEPVPPGVVGVRVPAERSEGPGASVNRAAMSRFSTICLLHDRRRIVILGGSPVYHRILREGLDPRLDVRLIPGNRRGRLPDIPSADLVILWASTILDHSVSAQFPEGIVVPHRSIARMLAMAAEWIQRP